MVDVRPLLFINILLLMLVIAGAVSDSKEATEAPQVASNTIDSQPDINTALPAETATPEAGTEAAPEDHSIFADTSTTPQIEDSIETTPEAVDIPLATDDTTIQTESEAPQETFVEPQIVEQEPEVAPEPEEPVVAKVEQETYTPAPAPVIKPVAKPKPPVTTGKLIIRSNVNDDTVLINGLPYGPTKLAVDLSPGTYTVEVAKKGYISWKSDITVQLGSNQQIRAALDEIRVVEYRNGSWINDVKTGEGTYVNDEIEYTGSLVNGLFHGKGNAVYSDGTQYQGEWFEGQMHGEGNLITSTDDTYTGQFKENTFNGEGTLSKKNGDIYTGYWVSGQLNGQGSLTTKDGLLYVGSFSNNQFHGQGSLTYPDSRHYEGSFSKGLYHGKGVETFSNGKKYSGQFMEGQYHGEGEIYYPSGSKIKATFKFGQPFGKAILTTPEGEVFEARTTEPGICYREKSYRATQCPSMEGWK